MESLRIQYRDAVADELYWEIIDAIQMRTVHLSASNDTYSIDFIHECHEYR